MLRNISFKSLVRAYIFIAEDYNLSSVIALDSDGRVISLDTRFLSSLRKGPFE